MGGRWKSILPLVLGFFVLLTSYTNCAPEKKQEASSVDLSSLDYTHPMPGLDPINYFKEALPPSMSGATGYSFLLKEYFGPQCGSCHRNGSPWPPYFADLSNGSFSYNEAKTYLNKTGKNFEMLRRVTGTSNCHPYCDLDTRGQIYKAIDYWIQNR